MQRFLKKVQILVFFYMVKTFDLHQAHQTDSSNFYIVDNVDVSTYLASMVINENFRSSVNYSILTTWG